MKSPSLNNVLSILSTEESFRLLSENRLFLRIRDYSLQYLDIPVSRHLSKFFASKLPIFLPPNNPCRSLSALYTAVLPPKAKG